jgi:hypothetical protein
LGVQKDEERVANETTCCGVVANAQAIEADNPMAEIPHGDTLANLFETSSLFTRTAPPAKSARNPIPDELSRLAVASGYTACHSSIAFFAHPNLR